MANKTVPATIKHRRATAAEWESTNYVLAEGEIGYDTTNKITKMGDGSTPWKTLPVFVTTSFNFEKASWADIAAISESGRAAAYFGVGEEKTIELTTGEKVTLVILGFNHDDLTGGGKAGMTIGMKNLLATTYKMNSSNTNAGGWDDSAMRTSTMTTLLSQLPADLRNVIKQKSDVLIDMLVEKVVVFNDKAQIHIKYSSNTPPDDTHKDTTAPDGNDPDRGLLILSKQFQIIRKVCHGWRGIKSNHNTGYFPFTIELYV